MIEQEPKTLYPNSVANVLVEGLRAENPDFEVHHYGKVLFTESDGLSAHKACYDTTGVFINWTGLTPLDDVRSGMVEHKWRGRVRVTHHNPREETEQHQEGGIYAQRAQSYLQGTRIPLTTDGVEGGPRLLRTGEIEQVLNVPNFVAYRFPLTVQLQHNLRHDIS